MEVFCGEFGVRCLMRDSVREGDSEMQRDACEHWLFKSIQMG